MLRGITYPRLNLSPAVGVSALIWFLAYVLYIQDRPTAYAMKALLAGVVSAISGIIYKTYTLFRSVFLLP